MIIKNARKLYYLFLLVRKFSFDKGGGVVCRYIQTTSGSYLSIALGSGKLYLHRILYHRVQGQFAIYMLFFLNNG